MFDGRVGRFTISTLAATKKARAVLEMQSAISFTVFDRDFVEVVEVFEQILCWAARPSGSIEGIPRATRATLSLPGDLAKLLGAVFFPCLRWSLLP